MGRSTPAPSHVPIELEMRVIAIMENSKVKGNPLFLYLLLLNINRIVILGNSIRALAQNVGNEQPSVNGVDICPTCLTSPA